METNNGNTRILARSLARELTADELALVSGGSSCTKSTCSASDNSSCDLDQCGDYQDSSGPAAP